MDQRKQWESEINQVLDEARRVQRAMPFDKTAAAACLDKLLDYINRARNEGDSVAERELAREQTSLSERLGITDYWRLESDDSTFLNLLTLDGIAKVTFSPALAPEHYQELFYLSRQCDREIDLQMRIAAAAQKWGRTVMFG
jgi:hypothetical protein